MDVVIAYVNGNRPVWREAWNKRIGKQLPVTRFRDWGTLRYLMRGIDKYMPYIENVFLVVSDEDQVPEWLDRNNARVVLHSQIIPAEYLPTFNSSVIECYFQNIPDLAEEYIYFNDDVFPVRLSSPEDFFVDHRPKIALTKYVTAPANMFQRNCKNSSDWAFRILGFAPPDEWYRPHHGPAPMLKSVCEKIMSDASLSKYLKTASGPVRDARNITQYIFGDYMGLNGHIAISSRINYTYIGLCKNTMNSATAAISEAPEKFICLNDCCDSYCFSSVQKQILRAFEMKLPSRSRFEV